jgi:hypothetical protein
MMAMNPRQQRLPAVWLVNEVFGKWQALLAEPAPSADRVYLNGAWHYFRGRAFAGLGEIDKADHELKALAQSSRGPALKDVLSGANSAGPILAMLSSALSGEIAKARGRYGDAVLAFEQAVRLQDALNFNEPPDWPHSMRLYLEAALLKAGRPKMPKGCIGKNSETFVTTGGPCSACGRVCAHKAEAPRHRRFEKDLNAPGETPMSSSVHRYSEESGETAAS